ncbi:MAG TPA: APC family permease [Acidobacteriaceae bacterium]|jgi:amino acid transporter|nr:APC family permease [Acidobacteriaceae bacterium]
MPPTERPQGPNDHHLHRPLRLRDLVLAQILCVVGSSWVGVAAGLGRAQSIVWVAAMLLFYLPMAASVICLNRLMPLEGGLYVWARAAFGDLIGFLTAWNLWVYGIAVTATILYAIPTEISYLIGPSAAWLPDNHRASLAIVAVLVTGLTCAALRGLELGKWIHNIGGLAILIVFAGLILLPLAAAAHHASIFYTPFSIAMPALDWRTLALFGQMLFGALCGLEYVSLTAGEARDPARSIGQSVVIASPIICVMFVLGTATIVALVPHAHIDFIAPIPQVMRLTLGANGFGNIAAILAILLVEVRLLGATSFLFTGVTRLPMAAGWNHLVPSWFTRLHPKRRTPTNSILCTGALVLALILLASTGVHAQEAYQLLTNASLTHYEVAYLAMFGVPLFGAAALRRKLPRWLQWTSAAGFASTLFSLLISAYPFVTVVSARTYAAKILSTIVVSNLLAVAFYFFRTRGRTAAETATTDAAGDSRNGVNN